MVKVLKKNGSEQPFSSEKIKNAIRKSAERVCVTLSEKEEKKIVDLVKKQLQYNETAVPVSTIHNMVEVALDNVNSNVAKSYREYRDSKSQFSAMLDKVYSKKLSLNFIGDRSNANSDSALVTTQKAIVYNELNSELYKKFFLTQKEERAMSDGYIYVHDRGSRLDTMNCCVYDMKNLITGGFFMGNLDYQEPKTLDVAFDLIGDVTLNAASSQYGGFTIPQVDKLFAPYAEKSYNLYLNEYLSIINATDKIFCDKLNGWKVADNVSNDELEIVNEIGRKADEYATNKVKRDFEQGFQSWEMKFNSVASSRGDYPFTAITFGLGTGKFETMCSSICMKVRKEGQGKPGFKHPVLFPKLSFFYDENLHGEGKELEWLFDEAIHCSMKSMYPDFISLTGDGYTSETYKKYGVATSKMGCRAAVSRWFEKGGVEPTDENDKCIMDGRFNMGAISLHFSMIGAKAKKEDKDYFEVLDYYLEMTRKIHKRTVEFLSHKKAGINPLGFCQGGFYGGNLDPDQELGMDFLKPMTISFGIIGLNEASVLMTGKPIHKDNTWAISVLKHINEYVDRIKKEDGILYAIYGTPGESLVATQVTQFRKKYGIIKGVSDKEYVTNSFHCPVYADITPIEKQDVEYPMFHLVNGGQIGYARMRSNYNFDAFKDITRRAMKMGFYWGNNQQLNYCEDCGYEFSDSDKCPKCNSEHITRITRMNGYLSYESIRGKTMYSDTKLKEFKDRISM
jgi:ribonucleoside-triphosphate reductase